MLTFELPSDEYRKRLRHALLKDLADMKSLRKKNVEEEADVSDIDYKITLIDGQRGGTPGLIQIFSTQTELFGDRKRTGDPAQMSIDDAIAESKEDEREIAWSDWVPSPRPDFGERVAGIDGIESLIIVDVLGYVRPNLEQNAPEDGSVASDGVFAVLAVAESLAEGFKPDDKRRVHVVAETTEGSTANWRQVTSPPPDVDAIREAARAGEVVDDQRTVTDLEEFGVSEGVSDSSAPSPEFDRVAASNGEALAQLEDEGKPQPRKRGRPRAAAGNLAGAVKREVAKATGDRKINPKRSGGGKK